VFASVTTVPAMTGVMGTGPVLTSTHAKGPPLAGGDPQRFKAIRARPFGARTATRSHSSRKGAPKGEKVAGCTRRVAVWWPGAGGPTIPAEVTDGSKKPGEPSGAFATSRASVPSSDAAQSR